jgi:hypothetical protein
VSTPTSYGTPYTALIQSARLAISAAKGAGATYKTDKFWSDDELFQYALRGTTDLWKAIIDLHHEHFLTLNSTDVSLQSGVNQLSGVPKDTFRVYQIESTTPTTTGCVFVPRAVNNRDFVAARWQGLQAAVTPTRGQIVYYCLTGVGAPNNAPVILTAPALSAAVSLNFWYVPILGVAQYALATATNPIPGESDQALIAWIIAYMRGKEREDRSPDPAWLAIYATEKTNLLTSLTPRQEQEAEHVESIF